MQSSFEVHVNMPDAKTIPYSKAFCTLDKDGKLLSRVRRALDRSQEEKQNVDLQQ